MSASKIVMVTGANSGIGYETVKAFLGSDTSYHVLVGSRSSAKADKAIDELRNECPNSNNSMEAIEIDLTSDKSIEKAFHQVDSGHGRLDALVNNAGATFDIEFVRGPVSLRECFNKAYDVNVSGTNVLTWTFVPLLLRSNDPRLLFVAGLSMMTQAAEKYFPTPPQLAGWPKNIDFETIGYRCSKTALNMLMLDWNHKLKADGIKVWSVGPGFLATNLGNWKDKAKEMGAGHPSAGGEMLVSVVEGKRDGDTGKLIKKDGFIPY